MCVGMSSPTNYEVNGHIQKLNKDLPRQAEYAMEVDGMITDRTRMAWQDCTGQTFLGPTGRHAIGFS